MKSTFVLATIITISLGMVSCDKDLLEDPIEFEQELLEDPLTQNEELNQDFTGQHLEMENRVLLGDLAVQSNKDGDGTDGDNNDDPTGQTMEGEKDKVIENEVVALDDLEPINIDYTKKKNEDDVVNLDGSIIKDGKKENPFDKLATVKKDITP